MSDIFISYKREDRDDAREIAEYLAERGYGVWWDIDLLPGDRFADEINELLRSAKAAIVLWTPESATSTWVKSEATIALERNILIPVCLRNTEIPAPFNILHNLDLTSWRDHKNEDDLGALLRAVEALTQVEPHQELTPSKAEVSQALDRPRHEVEFWKSITRSQSQSPAEYQLYLDRYGKNATFADLAQARIDELSGRPNLSPKWSKGLAVAAVAVSILVGAAMLSRESGLLGSVTSGPPVSADCYAGSNTFLKNEGRWYEFLDNGDLYASFDELLVDDRYVTLVDPSRRNEANHPMLVRVPVRGGRMDWSWQNPISWQPMYIMTTEDPRCTELRRYL